MAFDKDYLARSTVGLNTGSVIASGSEPAASAAWTYRSAGDAVATIAAANYFADAVWQLSLTDWIFITGSDASGVYKVSAIDRAAGTISLTAASVTGAVDTANIVDLAVTTGKLADSAVTNVKVSPTAAIAFSKMENLADGEIIVGSAANVPTAVAVTGDVTIDNAGVTAIASDVIVNADIKTDAAIAFSKLESMASGTILVGSAGAVPTEVAMSGDATIVASGALTIANDAVTSAKVSAELLQYVSVAISAAEFNGMYAAPKLLVAAAGANTLITLHRAELLMTYVTTQFANGGVVAIQYDNTANGAGVIASTTQAAADFFDAADTANAFEGGVVKQPFATAVNKGLYLSNITGAFDTGDSTFVMHLWYSIVPTV